MHWGWHNALHRLGTGHLGEVLLKNLGADVSYLCALSVKEVDSILNSIKRSIITKMR